MADRPNRFVPTLSSSFVLPLSPVSFLPLFLYGLFYVDCRHRHRHRRRPVLRLTSRSRPQFDASLNDIRSNGDRDTMRVSGIFFVRGYFSSRLLIWCATFSFSFTIQSRFFHDSSRRPVVTVRFFSLVYSIHFLFRTFAFYTLFFFSFRFCKFRFDVYLSSILQW